MTKPETVPTPVREQLALKSTSLTVNRRDFVNKYCIIHMDDSVTLQDIQDNPTLFRVIQKSRDKALSEGDSVELRWPDQIAFSQVDYADGDEVYLLKPQVFKRRERNRTPWQNATYQVRAINGQWSYFRKSDGVRMTTHSWPDWQAAMQACIREQAPARV